MSNLRFAAAVEPGNAVITEHTDHCHALIDAGQPTLPSTLALELQINPFLRCGSASVIASARSHGATVEDPVGVITALRSWKDPFR